MLMIEERAKGPGIKFIALGSTGMGKNFYLKLGYTEQLLIQCEKHSLEDLLSWIPAKVFYTNDYDKKIN